MRPEKHYSTSPKGEIPFSIDFRDNNESMQKIGKKNEIKPSKFFAMSCCASFKNLSVLPEFWNENLFLFFVYENIMGIGSEYVFNLTIFIYVLTSY